MARQTHSFQAEVAQLLHLVTHSLYSNPEIFLRELISNASDACDKLRFEALNNAALYEDAPNLEVRVSFDKAARTITIADNGIGLSQQEAIDNLGTIAKSGTKDFMGKLSGDQKADAQLIGQFGVGFYSGFIVADRITVESRRAGLPADQGVRWASGGAGDFEVDTITRAQRGTSIILHLREDAITDVWVVEKPTTDGVVTSVELFDASGELMAMFFGDRKPGQPERQDWRAIVGKAAPAASAPSPGAGIEVWIPSAKD